jgi:hypothetical protein
LWAQKGCPSQEEVKASPEFVPATVERVEA